MFYDFDSEMENNYDALHHAAGELSRCAAAWHIEASGKVYQRKYHAGADSLVRRRATKVRKEAPPFVKTNVETFSIGLGKQTLFLFPDRILIYAPGGVGAVDYRELSVDVSATYFVETESVPPDAEVVDWTWQYVNKGGGPDRRFTRNNRIPVCRYEEMGLSSKTGLNEIIQLSKCGNGRRLLDAIQLLGRSIPRENLRLNPKQSFSAPTP